MSKIHLVKETTDPTAPAAGDVYVYSFTGEELVLMDSAGNKYYFARRYPVLTLTASAVATANDGVVFIDASTAAVTYTLPDGATARGEIYTVKAINVTNTVTIAAAGTDTIEGSASIVLALNEVADLQWDGSMWRRIE